MKAAKKPYLERDSIRMNCVVQVWLPMVAQQWSFQILGLCSIFQTGFNTFPTLSSNHPFDNFTADWVGFIFSSCQILGNYITPHFNWSHEPFQFKVDFNIILGQIHPSHWSRLYSCLPKGKYLKRKINKMTI